MFFLPKSRFRLLTRYQEDPSGSLSFLHGRQSVLFRFLALLFYSFLYNRTSSSSVAFTSYKKLIWSWVYKNKFRIAQWDALRRYNYRFINRLKRNSLYKRRLIEYKKLKIFYFSLRDFQFRKFVRKGIPLYKRFKSHFLSFLEFRLLTFCVRLGVFKTHIEGRLSLRHFGLKVDTKRIYYSNYSLSPGMTLDLNDFFPSGNFSFRNFSLATFENLDFFITIKNVRFQRLFDSNLELNAEQPILNPSNPKEEKNLLNFKYNWFRFFDFFSSLNVSQKDNFFVPRPHSRAFQDKRFVYRSLIGPMKKLENRRLLSFSKSYKKIFFYKSSLYSFFSRQMRFFKLKFKLLRLVPKGYILISWALKKVFLIGYPEISDLDFPFLVDPVLALSFMANR